MTARPGVVRPRPGVPRGTARLALLWLAAWAGLFGLALLLDGAAYRALLEPELAARDWVQALRQLGYLPTWLVVAALLALIDLRAGPDRRLARLPSIAGGLASPRPAPPWHHRAGLLTLAALLGGLAANILKPAIGRLRPDEFGVTRFAARPALLWGDPAGIGTGLPSGHTTVAFAACGMLGLLMPAVRLPLLALAAGCGLTRLFAGAHALSDVVAGAGLGLAIAWALHAAGEGPRRGPAGGLLPRA